MSADYFTATKKPFLTAHWEYILVLNYKINPDTLKPFLPPGTELDSFQGDHYISLVGFQFLETKVLGFKIPGHVNFVEVNLRFYVTRKSSDGAIRRGVVFIQELVPRWAIATIAKLLYNEPYKALPMDHVLNIEPRIGGTVEYNWKLKHDLFAMKAEVKGPPKKIQPASEAEFILEHYWGYTKQRDGGTLEYQVEHPAWEIWEPESVTFSGPAEKLYGPRFGEVLMEQPISAFLARGSEVVVNKGVRI